MRPIRTVIVLLTAVLCQQPDMGFAQRRSDQAGAILREARANRATYEWFKRRQFNDDLEKISLLAREIANFRFRPLTENSLKSIRGKSRDLDKRFKRIIEHVGMGPETEPSDFADPPTEITVESIRTLSVLVEAVKLKLVGVTRDRELLDLDRLRDVVADVKSVQEFNRRLSTP
jgi:hypothetical protein